MHHHFGGNSASLNSRAVRCERAEENCKAAVCEIRVIYGADNVIVSYFYVFYVFADCLARNRHKARIEQALLRKLVHNGVYTACRLKILHMVVTCGCEVAKVGCAVAYFVNVAEVEAYACFLRDSCEVEKGVGGAAERHIYRERVCKRFFREYIERLEILVNELYRAHTNGFCKAEAFCVNRRHRAVAAQAHAERFRKAVHGVCREHTGAGAAAGASVVFVVIKVCFRCLAALVSANGFENAVEVHCSAALVAEGEHGAAGYENGGDIESCRRHKHTGNYLIAVGNEHKTVKSVCLRHAFNAVCDNFTGNEGVFHTLVTHCDTVANADHVKFNGCTACHKHAVLNAACDVLEVDVTGNDFVEGVNDTDERLSYLPVGVTHRLEKRALRRAFRAQFHFVASHFVRSPQFIFSRSSLPTSSIWQVAS